MNSANTNTDCVRAPDLLAPNPKLRLREQLREVMRFKHYSARTEQAYWHWIRHFIMWARAHPRLTPDEGNNPTPHPSHPQPLSPSDAERVARAGAIVGR